MKKSPFIYMTCQVGAENALKSEMARRHPDFHFSFSRPGFLTFKLPEPLTLRQKLQLDIPTLRTIFARTCVHSIGKVSEKTRSGNRGEMIIGFWESVREFIQEQSTDPDFTGFRQLHVWERDVCAPGTRGFEPGLTLTARNLYTDLLAACPASIVPELANLNPFRADLPGRKDEICLDCVLVAPDDWWIGYHRINDLHSRYAGGMIPLVLPFDASSRAWLKFEEGLRWSEFPIEIGSRCVDIGSSPGGGSQVLLARGAEVVGVDPAQMAPVVSAHPNFTWLCGKINQLKRRNFRKSRWFLTDMNVAPSYTLDALEELVTRPDISARGLLFTLKLFEWKLAADLPEHIRRIKGWGFNHVKVRQLQFNRQEVMVAALKKPFRK
ncbi:MAG: hypothetical protein IKW74_05085 [Thermoguttaceae bacterium]|nr:hypothetical protein [Thermoguttaceae bacterium]